MRGYILSIWSAVSTFGWAPGDTGEAQLKKRILITGSLLVILATLIWGGIFLLYNETLASVISIAYALVTAASLVSIRKSSNFDYFLKSQLFLGLALPFGHHVLLGGFAQSSGVLIWSIITPMGAMLFLSPRATRFWWMAFLATLVAASLLDPTIQNSNNLPPGLITIFFALNFGGVSTIVVLIISYFIGQREKAYRLLGLEEAKTQTLLRNVLPDKIAEQLKNEPRVIADFFPEASILFADLVNFTRLTTALDPVGMVNLLNEIFSYFDTLVETYQVEKIRTIGDNYMVVAGVPEPVEDHAFRLAQMALDMQRFLAKRQPDGDLPVRFRLGINSGPVIGGVIGHKKFVYDVWGDAVNIASRMQSTSEPGQIQVSEMTYRLIKHQFQLQSRGPVDLKGRGIIETWFLVGE